MNLRHRLSGIHWRSVLLTLAALAVLGVIGAGTVVGLGLYNVSARVGHLPGVSWILHTTFRNSVDLHAGPASSVPDKLDDPGMIALGAGHYDAACATCHASPGTTRTATALSMVPQPPHITHAVKDWTPAELHWIVHEGVKMSGMPGWPSPRKDEVWPLVAFLMQVDTMTPAEYADLTRKPDGRYCAMCHGSDGVSGNPQIPRLDILSAEYIALSLKAYRDGTRDSGIMRHAITTLPETAIPDLADFLARTEPQGTGGSGGPLADRGRDLAYSAGPNSDIPACRACHGPWPGPLDRRFPSIAGQYEPYLKTQLTLWRDSQRGGGAAAGLMHQAARNLTDQDVDALAAYYAALAPATLDRVQD